MAQLQLLDIPDELYNQLQTLASRQNRPLDAEIVHLLQKVIVLERVQQEQHQLLQTIQQTRWYPDQVVPDSVTLLREIRGYDD